MRLERFVLALLLGTCAAHAQLVPPDPHWQDAEVPPAPPLKTTGLIPVDIPRSSLRFGVDPGSISLRDGVVRYVVVATSPTGVVNAMYEGLRCESAEFKVYARHNATSGWTEAKDSPAWRSLHEQPVSRHTLTIARTGACIGRGPNRSAAQIARDLRSNVDMRFRQQ